MKTPFNTIPVLSVFRFAGTRWVKQSTRTAHVYGKPHNFFYFSKNEYVKQEAV